MWGIVGNEQAVEQLRRSVQVGRLHHAYLFHGPERVGKRTLALTLARVVNCLGPGEPPCGACRPCRLIARGAHPDVRVVERAADRKVITVQQVHEVIADAGLKPLDARLKVYLFRNAEALQHDAANALLKTLEEPPGSVLFVLTVTDLTQVLPTIVSRCQPVRLGPVPTPTIVQHLLRLGAEPDQARLIAGLADGRIGWAIGALGDASTLQARSERIGALHDVLGADRLERLQRARALAERWSDRPDLLRETLRLWLGWWRDALLLQAGRDDRLVNHDERAALATAACLPTATLQRAIAVLARALDDLEANVNPRLALDLALLDLPSLGPAGQPRGSARPSGAGPRTGRPDAPAPRDGASLPPAPAAAGAGAGGEEG